LRSRPEPLAPAQLPGLRERLADKRSTVFFERRQDAAGVERMGVLHVLYPGSIPVDFPLVAGLHRDRAAVYAEWRREVLIRGSLFGLVALLSVAGWGYQRSRQRAFKRLQADRESDQARAAAELSDSEARFRRLFEDMRQPVLLLQDGRCVAANRAAAALLQVDSPDELLGPFEGFRSPPMQPDGQPSGRKGLEMLDFARKTGSHAFEWQLLRRDGTPVTTQALVTVIRQGQNDLLHLVLNDVTEQKRMQERVEYLAFHDPVSGLPNRTAGLQRIGHELALARELRQGLAVLCLEITGPDLKRDSYGHGLEAPLFASVAARLAESLGVGSLIYHWESQRLLVLWPGLAGYEELARVGDRVLGSCNRPYGVEGLELHVQLGVGIAMYPQDGDDADTLTRHAEAALADAQGAGSGLARFYARQMDEAREDFLDTREALRLGLERGEFELYYQPQIALIDGSLHGAEALLRWRRPGLGLLAPGAFLEVAQASGLIVPLGMWVLRQACAQAVAWHAAGWKGLVVSVNLAEAQLRSEQTGHQLLELVLQSGLDPNRLELEFTEAALEAGGTAAEHMLSAWRARGIRLAIDRHGHGRSSLAQLQRIGVGRLKVVLGGAVSEAFPASDSPEGRLWHATAETARLMGMVSTAVGIESDDTVQALRAAGFTHGQGRFIAAPMSATDLQQMVIAVDARTALD
jgi:diguanylate cyclase (GGDEF)-like protein/PAS domain S-box-containing protein